MAQHCTLALVGTDEEILKEVETMISNSYLDLRVVYSEVIESEQKTLASLPEEVDIIVIDTKLTRNRAPLVSKLKGQFPLTETVVISFEKNYDLAIELFRAGVRDILQYPLERTEFISALERSQSYRSLYQKSESLTEIQILLNRFGDYKKFSSHTEFMTKVDQFILDKLQGDPFLVLSFAKDQLEENIFTGHLRTLWNKKLYQKVYNEDAVKKLVGQFKLKTIQSHPRPYIECLWEKELYYLVPLGEQEKSFYLGIFKLSQDTKTEYVGKILGHLCRVVQNGYQQLISHKEREELTNLIHVDDVTGLFNSRKLHRDLEEAIKGFYSGKEHFSVVFIDIDHFKDVNDGHGHLIGSRLLLEIARILKDTLRENDLIYRYGGDEFVVILPSLHLSDAQSVGERILNDIKSYTFVSDKKVELKLSVSVGIAEFPTDAKTKDEILNIADDMMYKAKNSGRGKVVSTREMFDNTDNKNPIKDIKKKNRPA
jgi:diguanylate cyclase (GGDEF)-like protein